MTDTNTIATTAVLEDALTDLLADAMCDSPRSALLSGARVLAIVICGGKSMEVSRIAGHVLELLDVLVDGEPGEPTMTVRDAVAELIDAAAS